MYFCLKHNKDLIIIIIIIITILLLIIIIFREGTVFIGGWVLSKYFTNWGGSNLFYSQPGKGHSIFGKEKITPCGFYFVYTSKATSQD